MLILEINGKNRRVRSDPETPLLFVLRNEFKLKGTKFGCGLEQCGACAVLVDGRAELTCARSANSFKGCSITTVEGLANTETGRRVQRAFVKSRAAQCGYCTAGLVVAVAALVSSGARGDRESIKNALTRHICRCGSHVRVLDAANSLLGARK